MSSAVVRGQIQTAYDMPKPSFDDELVLVGRGTPGGELFRRYWQPVAIAADIKDLPVAVRILGEDLILFREPGGSFGLMHPRCAHRGSSLLYGKVEPGGIRCCYHGWKFDTEGRCVEQPCEKDGGKYRDRVRQPWYPVKEQYGLVFAYMGPLDRMPGLPRFDVLEHVAPGARLVADDKSIGSGGPYVMPCNWLQTHENVMDGYHVPVLHGSFSGPQFNEDMGIMPETEWSLTDYGMIETKVRHLPGQRCLTRVLEVIVPNIRIVADPGLQRMGRADNVAWTVPIDDVNTKIFTVMNLGPGVPAFKQGARKMYGGKTWYELDEEGHQRYPGDYEAQVSQGEITLHSEEHLAGSDRGVVMLRRLLRQSIQVVQAGGDPVLAGPDANPVIAVKACNEMSG